MSLSGNSGLGTHRNVANSTCRQIRPRHSYEALSRHIAKRTADVNAAEADGSTAILWAASGNDVDLVTRLVKFGLTR